MIICPGRITQKIGPDVTSLKVSRSSVAFVSYEVYYIGSCWAPYDIFSRRALKPQYHHIGSHDESLYTTSDICLSKFTPSLPIFWKPFCESDMHFSSHFSYLGHWRANFTIENIILWQESTNDSTSKLYLPFLVLMSVRIKTADLYVPTVDVSLYLAQDRDVCPNTPPSLPPSRRKDNGPGPRKERPPESSRGREHREYRDQWDVRDSRDPRDYRDQRDSRDQRSAARDQRDQRGDPLESYMDRGRRRDSDRDRYREIERRSSP